MLYMSIISNDYDTLKRLFYTKIKNPTVFDTVRFDYGKGEQYRYNPAKSNKIFLFSTF